MFSEKEWCTHQINLNSFSVISEFFHLNSGLSLYLSNSTSHSATLQGGVDRRKERKYTEREERNRGRP